MALFTDSGTEAKAPHIRASGSRGSDLDVERDRADELAREFYSTPRASSQILSDGGGPFGFDIHAAFIFDEVQSRLDADAIIETGTCLGDTTDYLSRVYPDLPILSVEIDGNRAEFARLRLRERSNVEVVRGDSATVLEATAHRFSRPIFYLDAHWADDWPLRRELDTVRQGVAVVDDFDVGHDRFGFDSYGGVDCNAGRIKESLPGCAIWIPDVGFRHRYPCLQVGRRAGRAYVAIGQRAKDTLSSIPMLMSHD